MRTAAKICSRSFLSSDRVFRRLYSIDVRVVVQIKTTCGRNISTNIYTPIYSVHAAIIGRLIY